MSGQGKAPVIVLGERDNIAVALIALEAGQEFELGNLKLQVQQSIPCGHKLAIRPISRAAPILKCGQMIGIAEQNIAAGEHVHVHNVAMVPSGREHGVGEAFKPQVLTVPAARFMGIVRENGRVGTRNYLGVISSVNCSATVCRHIAQQFDTAALSAYPNVDGVVAITHGGGCGMSGRGEGIELLRRTLRGYADHANFAGVLVIGQGCEVNQLASLMRRLSMREPGLFAALTIQEEGGTREAIESGVALLQDMLPLANKVQRKSVGAEHLTVGLQCGGSDGYLGVSANPALGMAVDLLVRSGGAAVLSETPEIYGAEQLLTARAASPDVAERLMRRLAWWENYAQVHGSDMNNKPSPAHRAEGITTVLEKSLTAVAKGGSTGLMGVYEYAQTVRARGLVFMDTPGYEPVSATGQVAGGANLICFSTGRGSTYGCKPTPSLKLATNTPLFKKMKLDMDFDCGGIVEGEETVAQAGARLFQLMLDTASGLKSKSEENGLGDNEFLPWQLGAVM